MGSGVTATETHPATLNTKVIQWLTVLADVARQQR